MSAPLLPLTICADDYGLAPGIDEAILDLIERRRLAAVSCMVVGPSWRRSAPALRGLAGGCEIGLHFTLTHLSPAGPMPHLAPCGVLPGLTELLRRSLSRRLNRGEIAAELNRQIDDFEAVMGRPPDFLDGHQHVQQVPVVRDAVLAVFRDRLVGAGAWLRYPAMPPGDAFVHRIAMAKTWIIGALGIGFRQRGAALGIPGNGTFRGVRGGGGGEPPFAEVFRRFIRGLGPRPLLMCHPGFEGDPTVADAAAAGSLRRDEHAFLASDDFVAASANGRLRLAGLRGS